MWSDGSIALGIKVLVHVKDEMKFLSGNAVVKYWKGSVGTWRLG